MESYNNEKIDRFFLPVNKEVFNWFSIGKRWEIRNAKGRFNCKNLYSDRLIEIRKGYNGESLWGRILNVLLFEDTNELFEEIDYKLIFPQCKSIDIASKLIHSYAKSDCKVIATQIDIIETTTVSNILYK